MSSWHVLLACPPSGRPQGSPLHAASRPHAHHSPFTIHHSPFTIKASYIAEVAETDAARNPRIIFASETRCRRFRETDMRPPGLFSLTYRHRRTLCRPVGLLSQPCFFLFTRYRSDARETPVPQPPYPLLPPVNRCFQAGSILIGHPKAYRFATCRYCFQHLSDLDSGDKQYRCRRQPY